MPTPPPPPTPPSPPPPKHFFVWGRVTLERTFYSRAACPGGHMALVRSVWGDTVHGGTGSTPTTVLNCSVCVCVCSHEPLLPTSFLSKPKFYRVLYGIKLSRFLSFTETLRSRVLASFTDYLTPWQALDVQMRKRWLLFNSNSMYG